MARYVVTAAVAAGILLGALGWRAREAASPAPLPDISEPSKLDSVEIRETLKGTSVSVRHRLGQPVSRATLVYEKDGREHVADAVTRCTEAMGARGLGGADPMTLELSAEVPAGARRVRLLLEDETGVRAFPVVEG